MWHIYIYAMEFRLVKRMIRGTRGCKTLALFSNFKWARSPAFRQDAGVFIRISRLASMPPEPSLTLDIDCCRGVRVYASARVSLCDFQYSHRSSKNQPAPSGSFLVSRTDNEG